VRRPVVVLLLALPAALAAQAPRKWPPDSLVNVQVIPRTTPPIEVVGMMRNFAGALGVRCTYCHEGAEGTRLQDVDFASDAKRTKLVARQMMRMVQEINRRLDTIPERPASRVEANCATCHRGVARPVPLPSLVAEVAVASGADSASRVYRMLRQRHFGRDAYDFGETSLNAAAFRTARAGRPLDALALLALNEEFFPSSSSAAVTRGNVQLLRGDTTAAAEAFREALRRDARNEEARGRLRDIGRTPD
jgi:hypothetical protein